VTDYFLWVGGSRVIRCPNWVSSADRIIRQVFIFDDSKIDLHLQKEAAVL
jgi:hypothetical protein